MHYSSPLKVILLSYAFLTPRIDAAAIPRADRVSGDLASRASPNPAALLSKRSNDACGNSSFVNKSSSGSPTVGDCNCIRNQALAAPRSYLSHLKDAQQQGGWHRLAACGTCVFGVKTSNAFGTIVGTSDIADLIRDSINRFQWNGRVGAEGNMGCINGIQTASTNWAIFHS